MIMPEQKANTLLKIIKETQDPVHSLKQKEAFIYDRVIDTEHDNTNSSWNQMEFYRSDIQHFFKLYLKEKITLEQFIDIKNSPNLAHQQLEHQKSMAQPTAIINANFIKFLQDKFGSNKSNTDNIPPQQKKSEQNDILNNIIFKVKNEKSPDLYVNSSKRIKRLVEKLRRTIQLKKKEIRESQQSFHNTIFFDYVNSLAKNTIRKIERNNLVDFFDVNSELNEMSYRKCKNMTVKSRKKDCKKKNSLRAKNDYGIDAITEKIRLKKFLTSMDRVSSTYVANMKEMFDQTSDHYFDSIRPQPPHHFLQSGYYDISKSKEDKNSHKSYTSLRNNTLYKGNQKLGSSQRIKTPYKNQTFSNRQESNQPQKIQRSPFKRLTRRNNKLKVFKPTINFLDKLLKEKKKDENNDGVSQLSKVKSFSSRNDKLNFSRKRSPLKKLNGSYSSKPKKYLEPIFNCKFRQRSNKMKEQEFEFYKEYQLLNFLKLNNNTSMSRHQRKIRKKIEELLENNNILMKEKEIIIDKINHFNPLDTKNLEQYLTATDSYQVSIINLTVIEGAGVGLSKGCEPN